MRLIDADLAKQKIVTLEHEPDYQHEGEDWSVGLCMAESVLDEVPTSDIAEQIFTDIEAALNKHFTKLNYTDGTCTFVFHRDLEIELADIKKKYEAK
jgi:hypothetical protein